MSHAQRHVKACFADYESALKPFRILANSIDQWVVILAYWKESAKGMPELSKYLQENLRANTTFAPQEVESEDDDDDKDD